MKLTTLLVCCLLSVVCSVCHGTDWYVSESGSGAKNGTSPNDTWDRIHSVWGEGGILPGDTVYLVGELVAYGAYGDGTSGNYITITGYDANSVITSSFSFGGRDWIKFTNITVAGYPATVNVQPNYSENIWIDHVTMESAAGSNAIRLDNCKNVRISYCNIDGYQNGILTNAIYGIEEYITIDHCVITNMYNTEDAHCIGLNGGNHCIIEYNDLSYANTGVTLYGTYINNNIVRYNNIHHMEASRSEGTQRGYGIGFEGNVSEGCTRTGNYIYNNLVYSCTGVVGSSMPASGIRTLFYDNTNYVFNNTVYNCSPNYTINSLSLGGVAQPSSVVFKNNISLSPNDSSGAVYQRHVFVGYSVAGYSGLDLDYNCYYADSNDLFRVNSTDYTFVNWKTWLDGVEDNGIEANSINANPLLTNPDANDLSLQSTSPCIDAGVWVGLSTDYAGNNIIHAADIGAYEYQSILKKYARIRK